MTETGEKTQTLTRQEWYVIHLQAHGLFEAIWARMQPPDNPGGPMAPDWHDLNDLLNLAGVISSIAARRAEGRRP